MPTKVRAFRINDELYEKAQYIAEINEMTVTDLITTFFSKLRVQHEPVRTAKNLANNLNPKGDPPRHADKGVAILMKNWEDAKNGQCQHPNFKTIPYGTFCRECGVKVS